MVANEALSILVIDDSEFFASMLADRLESDYGMRTTTITNPTDALSAVASETVDCIVSDYQMPELNGIELYQEVESEHDLPFVLVTSEGDEEIASRAVGAGVDEYIRKQDIKEKQSLELLANRIQNAVERHQTKQKYERLINNSPDEISQVRLDGTILAANEAMATAFGTTQSDLVGEQLSALVPDDVAENRLKQGRRAITAGSAVTFQDSIGVRHFHNIVVPLSTGSENESVQFVTREITLQKRSQEELEEYKDQLEQSNRKLERQNEKLEKFASVVSHDLRNPLGIANSYLEFAEETGNEEDFETVRDAHRRMETMIEELLTMARAETTVEDRETLELDALARDAWGTAQTDGATLEREQAAVTVEGDRELLRNVFENLFRNAVDHNNPPVVVRVGPLTGDASGFYIEDDGDGIPEDERAAVFEHGHTTNEDGTGFGLSIVKEFVTAHGWEITVTNGAEGGARFEVRTEKRGE